MSNNDTGRESRRSMVEARLRQTLRHRADGPVEPRRFEPPGPTAPTLRVASRAAGSGWRWAWAGGGMTAAAAGAFLLAAVWGSSREAHAPAPATLGTFQLVADTPPTSSVPLQWDRAPYEPTQWSAAPTPTRGAAAGREWAVAPWVSDGTSNDVVCLEEASTRSRQCQTTLVLGERGSTGVLSVGPTLDGPANTKLLPVIAGVEVTEVRIAYNDGTVDAVRANPVGSGVPAVMAVTAVPDGVSSATVTWFTPDGPGGTRYLRLSYPTPAATGA